MKWWNRKKFRKDIEKLKINTYNGNDSIIFYQ